MLVTISADSNEQLTCPYIDSGCIRVQDRQLLAPSFDLFDFFAIGSSEVPVGCPRRESKTNSQSRSSSRGRTSSHICTQTPDPRFIGRASKSSTNVGAGCSCHPTSANHLRSPRVPLHPVWPAPVARFRGPILLASHLDCFRFTRQFGKSRQFLSDRFNARIQLQGRFQSTDLAQAALSRLFFSILQSLLQQYTDLLKQLQWGFPFCCVCIHHPEAS